MIGKKLQLTVWSILLLVFGANAGVAHAATATGRLSCMDATTTSNLIYVEFTGAGTTGANLYRYGADHAIATYPNRDSGKGSFNDTGLGSGNTYHYELHSGSQVLDAKDCTTTAPAPAPAPSQSTTSAASPPSSTPTPSSQPAAPATSSTPSSTPATTTTRQSTSPAQSAAPAVDLSSIFEATTAVFQGQTDTPQNNTKVKPTIIIRDTTKANKIAAKGDASNSTNAQTGIMAAICLAVGTCMLLFRRFRKAEPVAEQNSNYASMDVSSSAPPVPPPMVLPPVPGENNGQANVAYFTAAPTSVARAKADEPEDMYEIANKYPGSFGNVHYADNLNSTPEKAQSSEPANPLRMASPLPASQLHNQPEPTDPYSDRTKLG